MITLLLNFPLLFLKERATQIEQNSHSYVGTVT